MRTLPQPANPVFAGIALAIAQAWQAYCGPAKKIER
jgi:hypothetical protein